MAFNNPANIGYDLTFELNEFNQPKIRSEIETIKNVILYILFSKPGQYPSLPTIGLDIQTLLFTFYDKLDTSEIKEKLEQQCSALGYYIRTGSVGIRKTMYRGHPSLLIHIEGSETYPDGYMKDSVDNSDRYLIGITFNDMNDLQLSVGRESDL